MAKIKVDKVVSSLPDPLVKDTIYAVRVGTGFDLYLTDSTGSTAHKINQVPYSGTPSANEVLTFDGPNFTPKTLGLKVTTQSVLPFGDQLQLTADGVGIGTPMALTGNAYSYSSFNNTLDISAPAPDLDYLYLQRHSTLDLTVANTWYTAGELSLTALAGTVYEVELVVRGNTGGSSPVNVRFTVGSGTISGELEGDKVLFETATAPGTAMGLFANKTSSNAIRRIYGFITTSANTGVNIEFQDVAGGGEILNATVKYWS